MYSCPLDQLPVLVSEAQQHIHPWLALAQCCAVRKKLTRIPLAAHGTLIQVTYLLSWASVAPSAAASDSPPLVTVSAKKLSGNKLL